LEVIASAVFDKSSRTPPVATQTIEIKSDWITFLTEIKA
jgi:hypothetical protein